jgi:hypothetical protein
MGIFPSLSSDSSPGPGTSNYTGLGIEGAGITGQGLAAIGTMTDQHGIYQANQNIANDQSAINQVNYNTARMTISRNQLQETRNAQVARATAIAGATNQGAQFGSGLAGGTAQVTDQAQNNLLGLNQAMKSAGQIFTLNQDISNQNRAATSYGNNASMWQGIGQIASGVTSLGSKLATGGIGS